MDALSSRPLGGESMTVGHGQSDALEGQLLGGRYRVESLIGRGGMANVYRATDEVLHRGVAVKLFGDASDDVAHSARAATEVHLLAALNHPSLVTLYDARVDGDQDAFLVMELVDGPTLRDRIADGAIGRVDIAAMAADLAEALQTVHDAGMVHRDVKPSNVLLAPSVSPTREFRAKLADFGIAHLVDSARLTVPGTIMGTAAYLSPEQTRGVAPAPAGDVYSLGLVLLESFTRTRAFPGSMTESLVARVQRDPLIPGDLGYAWKSLLTSMTSRTPDARPTAIEVAAAARDILRSEGTGPLALSDTTTLAAPPYAASADAETAMLPATAAIETDTRPAALQAAGPLATTGTRRALRTAPSAAGRSTRPRRRLVAAGAAVAVLIGVGSGLASMLAAPSADSATDDGTGALSELATSIEQLSAGVTALVSDSDGAPSPEVVPATDTNDPDAATDGVTTVPPADEPSPEETTPAPSAPDPAVPGPADDEPVTPGSDTPGNGNNPGNGNGPGNNSGNGGGNGNGKGAGG
jgi:tRNA A-37 threonylcarbamoyl transferase component Bud32